MKIPKKPRYKYVMEKVYEFIIDNNISYYPLDVVSIIKQNKWSITKYSEFGNKYNYTNDIVGKILQSNDGRTHLFIENEKYMYSIIYNDDLNVNTDERIRFTLAHEIGHIYLNHLKDFEETEVQRNGLDNKSYSILEKEADMFARNLLCPYPLLKKVINDFQCNSTNVQIISETFKISKKASEIRLNLINYDRKYNYDGNLEIIKILGYKYCDICWNSKINCYNICDICGNYWSYTSLDYIKFMEVQNNIMQYSNYEYVKCDNCDNENIIENSNFCHICGIDLRNLCMNDDCKNNNISLSYNARFCNLCGSKSTFFENGKLNDWSDELKQYEIEQNLTSIDSINDDNLPF
ncbi:ImmA/IrrE family metallo-endopeptidase [[Clostridium] colinum]|uniref:ImmA/IrrE family metallo-endopeptidase n=1 Tax=[Clostridium] colinum TaxID=36835 RepID=UPI0020246671|nr:ImmA/IrrE family metallo-endopeptidase [[Clostridium] colinum]